MRYWEFATYLGREHNVSLLAPNGSEVRHAHADVLPLDVFSERSRRADVIISQGFGGYGAAAIAFLDVPQVFDLYCPIPFETLEYYRAHPDLPIAASHLSYIRHRLHLLLRRGDFFLCASEEQRHFWLGELYACGRVSLPAYRENAQLRNILDVVPLGVPPESPRKEGQKLRRLFPTITDNDFVLVWFGGIWEWLDPLTLIRAIARVAQAHPEVKLVFLVGNSPPVGSPRGQSLAEAIAESKRLGLYGRQVLFCLEWIPYAERADYLLDGDAGVVLYRDNLETEFAFRTRLVDYFWTGLPVICTRGDSLAQRVEQQGAGICVPPLDEAAVQSAVERLACDLALRAHCRQGSERIRESLQWPQAIKPLLEYCRCPRRAEEAHRPSAKASAFGGYMLSNAGAFLLHPSRTLITQAARRLREDLTPN
ncbi:MAG: glycosyltransferase [Chloroflexi bacterium]|nr:glycosyltransferase [Chloroflexota bacterium]